MKLYPHYSLLKLIASPIFVGAVILLWGLLTAVSFLWFQHISSINADHLENAKIEHYNMLTHIVIFSVMNLLSFSLIKYLRVIFTCVNHEQALREKSMADKTLVLQEEIRQHKKVKMSLQRYITHDPLTGINNRRYFIDTLNNELIRHARYKSELSVLMIDLDGFKKINHQHGYEFGDKVLIQFSTFMKGILRETDTFARYDGEEFAIIATNTKLDSAFRFAQKIVKDINQHTIIIDDQSVNLSVSVGVSEPSTTKNITSEKLLSIAHTALHLAKSQGRNQAIMSKA